MRKRTLARRLGTLEGVGEPRVDLEQYPTPSELAAHIVHLGALQNDLTAHTVFDLGCGAGILALGAALYDPSRVVGLDCDDAALRAARANERRLDCSFDIDWLHGDATRAPLRAPVVSTRPTTVLMNPPFGAQNERTHADRRFLETARTLADVSYSIHNAGSLAFLESYVADNDGSLTHAFEAPLELEHQFDFHTSEGQTITAEVVRIEWQ